ncbi:RecD-like DNA helicase YrrC [Desulfurella amilsii]|jgi:exodeoxyribonuclease V alpha subunit|uniref:RecD-like DNA helicase YrrC n=1 Tax=Desulfurella amilsii TaxID=1562698 RepID=A0A1X4XYC7_9BACT|nr:AAA family ATPase [Desulfurella amilsii]OSS42540.1 RecD-like DNA helicase YrrC [Desulfurella amilsii]
MKIEATIKTVTFYNGENSFAILQLTADGKNVTAKGVCPDLKLIDSTEKAKGLSCIIEGNWVKHPKYGEQIDAINITINTQGLFFFLANIVKGLGATLAKQLIKEYGETELVNILNNNPEKLLSFKGIKEKKLKKIIESWHKYSALKNLTEFFANNNVAVTSSLLLRIYNHFKEKDAIKEIKENPYCLTDVRGIGFKTADKLALQLGIDPYSPHRIQALTDYILLSQASNNGHTFVEYNDLLKLMQEEADNINLEKLIFVLKNILQNQDKYYIDNNRISLAGYEKQEANIERDFFERYKKINDYWVQEEEAIEYIAKKENELDIKFSNKQKQAIFDIATKGYNAFILCGYAGTGKSTISKIILDFYKEHFFKDTDIVTCAFTGMASKRIREVTGYKASTIHSLLGYKDGGFEYDRSNPLPYKVILIDESSMINLGLFYSLLKAISKDTIIIMVGDDAQLPPIGEGNVFADLLGKEWMPKVKLDTIYRQSQDSVLTYFANYIRQGQLPAELPPHKSSNFKDFAFIYKDISNYWQLKKELSDKQMQEIREEFYKELQADFLNLIKNKAKDLAGIKKIWDIQVITAMKNTPLGTKALNDILQKEINNLGNHSITIRGYLLKQYDKVIHLKNQNMKFLPKSEYDQYIKEKLDLSDMYEIAGDKRIYNGNLGLVLNIDEENEMFSVIYPEPDGENTVALYSFDDYHNIVDLGYALTIHKTQGNQFNYVFIPMINGFYIMLSSKLIYTAITRAKEKVYITGQYSAFKKACTNINKTQRNTWLRVREIDLMEN